MTEPRALAVAALLEAAEPDDWSRLLASARELLTIVAKSASPVPAPLVEYAFATGDAGLLLALTENGAAQKADPELNARLAANGSAAVMAAAITFRQWSYDGDELWTAGRLRSMLSRPGPDDPVWNDPDLNRLLLGGGYHRHHSAVVVCRAPGVAAKAYREKQPLSRADALRALASAAEADGLDTVAELLAEHDVPDLPRPLDLATLRAAAEHAEGTEGLITALREGGTSPAYLLSLRETIDWAAVTAEHARKKFVKDVVKALTSRPDCPIEAARALGDVAAVAAAGDHDWVIDHAAPAKNALKALRGTEVARLDRLVADVLGADPAAWRATRVEVARHKGTIAELFTLLAERVRTSDLPDKPAPADVPPPPPGGRLNLKIADAAFLTLLDAASRDVRLGLLTRLDGPAAHALLTLGREHLPEWTDFLIALGDTTLLTCLADDRRLPPEDVARLMALDVPEISHALGARHRDWPPRLAKTCPDTGLRTVILTKVHVRGEIPRLRILLDEWERHGREGLPEMIKIDVAQSGLPAFTAPIRRRIEALLARDDESAALAELRTRVEEGETAAAQIALLRKASAKYKPFGTEHHDWRWAELAAEHRREPLDDHVLWDLTRSPDCPAELRELADGLVHHWETDAEAAIAAGKDPVEVLTEHPVDPNLSGWIRRLLAGGSIDWADLFEHARPAEVVLSLPARAEDPDAARKALAPLVVAHLGTTADTWQLALALLPEFTGSPAEMLRTAELTVHGRLTPP